MFKLDSGKRPFSRRGDAHLRRTVNKFQRPSILQLNIEGLTASKMSVLHHLALQCEALVILLQETHCTSVERLDLPSYHLAGFSLSRKHGLATFVHERLKWILIDQSPPTSEIEWVCVDVDNYKIVNVYKPPPTRMQASDLPAFSHPCLYAGDFNCHHVDWGYNNNNPDGECLAGWASANNFTLLYNPKEAASFYSGRAGMRSVKTSISISCSHLGALIRIGLPQPYSQGSTGSGEIAGQRRSATLTFCTPAGWHGILQTTWLVGHDNPLVNVPFQLMLLLLSWLKTGNTKVWIDAHLGSFYRKCLTFGGLIHYILRMSPGVFPIGSSLLLSNI